MNTITFESPLGRVNITASEDAIKTIAVGTTEPLMDSDSPLLVDAKRQFDQYFAGEIKAFNLPIEPEGTEFQKAVWNALLQIPFGQTRTYLNIATQLGKPTATRAVGAANGQNPIWIVIPCHRVIGSNGALTGYAGGIERKRYLLELEGALPQTLEI